MAVSSMLRADSEGFLIGETMNEFRRNNDLLDSIKSDIHAIKLGMAGLSGLNKRSSDSLNNTGIQVLPNQATRQAVIPSRGDVRNSSTGAVQQSLAANNNTSTATPSNQAFTQQTTSSVLGAIASTSNQAVVTPALRVRDTATGRFVSNNTRPVTPNRGNARTDATSNNEGD
jgi:hypothetical protein